MFLTRRAKFCCSSGGAIGNNDIDEVLTISIGELSQGQKEKKELKTYRRAKFLIYPDSQ